MQEELFGLDFDFLDPPPRKTACPIIDAHTHLRDAGRTQMLVDAAKLYGIEKMLGITDIETSWRLREAYPGFFLFACWFDHEHLERPQRFVRDNLRLFERAAKAGFKVIKFWFKPEFTVPNGIQFDDPRLAEVHAAMAEHGLAALIHIADPDVWFKRRYADAEVWGTKAGQYPQLENALDRTPGMRVIAAHMGGDPEHLEHLDQLLADHPNLYFDLSATKWMARELGRQPEAAREFICKWRGRLLFGSDIVVRPNWTPRLYRSRYWIHRKLWESGTSEPLPIEDPDCDGRPMLNGIDLPVDVLERILYHNAAEFFNL